MADPNYVPTVWVDDGPPPVSAANLNHLEVGVEDAHERITVLEGSGGGTLARVTALPASPVDGDEVSYVADDAAGVEWHLKYHAVSASWRKIGGPPLIAEFDSTGTTASASYTDLGVGAFPAIALPLNADGYFDYGVTVSSPTVMGSATLSIAGSASSADRIRHGSVNGGQPESLARRRRKLGLASGAAVKLVYRTEQGTDPFGCEMSWLSFDPIRVW